MTNELSDEILQSLKAEGVTESDIQCWWGLSNTERDEIKKEEQALVFGTAIYFTNQGMSPKDAMYKVMKTMTVLSDYPLDAGFKNEASGLKLNTDDYPLPWELGKRIGNYINNLSKEEQEIFKKKAENFSSINAFLRNKIRNGEI